MYRRMNAFESCVQSRRRGLLLFQLSSMSCIHANALLPRPNARLDETTGLAKTVSRHDYS